MHNCQNKSQMLKVFGNIKTRLNLRHHAKLRERREEHFKWIYSHKKSMVRNKQHICFPCCKECKESDISLRCLMLSVFYFPKAFQTDSTSLVVFLSVKIRPGKLRHSAITCTLNSDWIHFCTVQISEKVIPKTFYSNLWYWPTTKGNVGWKFPSNTPDEGFNITNISSFSKPNSSDVYSTLPRTLLPSCPGRFKPNCCHHY